MNSLPLCFRNNFISAYQSSGFRSYRSLSHAAGTSSSRVQKIVRGDFDDSNVGPGIFTIDRMCKQLNVTPNDLLGYQRAANDKGMAIRSGMPSIEKLVSLYSSSRANLASFTEFERFLQVYDEPKDGNIHLVRSGELSLAARAAGTNETDFLQDQYFLFTKETKQAIYTGQRRAWDNGIGLEVLQLDHDMPDQDRRAKFSFMRAAFRLSRPDGEDHLAVYCELVV